jgi:uncharacterized protein DUF4431
MSRPPFGVRPLTLTSVTGTLTIINNRFMLKLPEEFSTETEFTESGKPEIVSTKIMQIICDDEDKPGLRKLLGKKIMVEGEVFAAHTIYHKTPILIMMSKGAYGEVTETE